jgi:hypothetical protein
MPSPFFTNSSPRGLVWFGQSLDGRAPTRQDICHRLRVEVYMEVSEECVMISGCHAIAACVSVSEASD